ncbi:hypothetical protein AB0O91_29145 [Kitasatospora sp. NPDC089797]|uniref:hypothetical protein n=1 Tax=Kitasatospora sp. NPDC089797 TaxID=3155298 RepID=UPI0034199A37
MRHQPRRLLAVAAAAVLVPGLALTAAPAALAIPTTGSTTGPTTGPTVGPTTGPTAGPTAPDRQDQASLIKITTSGMPTTVKAGTSVELTSTLRNTADHRMDVTTGFVVTTVRGSGPRPSRLELAYQRPGDTRWKDATALGTDAGGLWDLDPFATELHLESGAEYVYRLRLTFAADAAPGPAGAALSAVVSDPTLPPEQRGAPAWGSTPGFTVESGTPTTPAPVGLPDVTIEGLPATFVAGGEAKPFRAVFGNHTGTDLRVVPAIVFQGEGMLRADMVKLEFQTQAGLWIAGTPEWHDLPGTRLGVQLSSGSKDADVIALPNGGTRTVNLRLAWTKEAPAAAESVFADGYSLAGPGGTERGTSSPGVDFRIEAATGATGTPAPTAPATPTDAPAVPAVQVAADAPVPAAAPAQAAAPAPAATRLASTGGGSSSAPTAITGATAIALGLGILVVARRRNRAGNSGN